MGPHDLGAAIYHALDVPVTANMVDGNTARPIATGKPVLDLFG